MSFTPSGDQQLAVEITASDEGASEAFDDVADSATGVKTAVAGASAVLAGAGVAALGKAAQAAADFEQAMVEVEKVTNPETAEQMSESIREMATEIPMAQQELAGLAADAGRFGIEGPENIEKFTRSVAKMAEATNLSAQEAGESLARLAELTNTPVDKVENLGSAINSLSNNFATSSQEIVDAMLRASGSLTQLGLSTKEIAGLSASLNEVSESSERAGTRLRRLGQELLDPKTATELATALGMTESKFEQMRKNSPNQLIKKLVRRFQEGGKAADGLRSALSTTSRQALAGLAQNMEGLESAQSKANSSFEKGTSLQREFEAATDTFNAKLQLLKNQLGNIAIVMGNALLPILTSALERVMPLVEDFAQLNKQMDGMPGVVMALTAVLGGLAGVVYALGISVTTTLAPAIAIVGALAAAGYALYKAWKTNFGGIRDVVTTAFDVIRQTLNQNQGKFNAIKSTLRGLWKQFQVAFDKILAIVKFVIQNYSIPLIKRFQKIWKRHFSEIATETMKTMDAVLGAVKVAGKLISKFWDRYGTQIMRITKTAFKFIELYVGTALDAMLTTIKVVLALIRGDWQQALTYIKNFTNRTLDKVVKFLKGPFIKGWTAALNLVWKAVVDVFKGIYNFLIGGSIVPKTFNAILSFITGTFLGGLTTALKRVFKIHKKVFQMVKNAILSVFDSIKSSALDTVEEMGDAVLTKIRDVVSDFKHIFNSAIPDSLSVPSITVGGGGVSMPEELGGGFVSIPSATIGGQSLDLPQLAEGGIVDSTTIAMIGEAGKEAVVPLDKLSSYLDTAYEAGTRTAVEAPVDTGSSSSTSSITASLHVEGDGVLADLIREKAELVVEENEQDKRDRLSRL